MASKFKFTYIAYVRSEIELDCDEDADFDMDEIIQKFNEDVSFDEDYIANLNLYLEENDLPKIAAVDVSLGDGSSEITIYSNVQISEEDLRQIVETIADDIDVGNQYFNYSAELVHPSWNALSDYGYEETSEYRDDLEGEASITIYSSDIKLKEGKEE